MAPVMISRNPSVVVVAAVVLLGAGAAYAQSPDKEGVHKYAGKTCPWASYESGGYIEMSYGDFKGRVEPADHLSATTNPFNWQMFHPDGETTTRGNASTAKGALNGLCGHMIVSQGRLEQARSYDRGEAYQALVDALEEEPGN